MQLFVPSTPTHRSGSSNGFHFLQSFVKLVATLRHTKSTCTVIEQGCGGLISASILMQPGASQCYIGSSIIYNTAQCQPLLLSLNNNTNMTNNNAVPISLPQLFHDQLPLSDRNIIPIDDDEVQNYIQSKIQWTTQMAIQYCTTLKTDYAIAEGGAVGPTFRPKQLKHGFSVIAIAGRQQRRHHQSPMNDMNHNGNEQDDTVISILRQEIVFSPLPSTSRIQNMYTFAQTAANICRDVVMESNDDVFVDDGSTTTTDRTSTTTTVNESMIETSSFSSQERLQKEVEEKLATVSSSADRITFDRAAHVRSNPTRVHQLLYTSNQTKFVLLYKKQMLIQNYSTNKNENTAPHVEVAYLHRAELQQYFMDHSIPFLEETEKLIHPMDAISFLGTLQQQDRLSLNNENTTTGSSTIEMKEKYHLTHSADEVAIFSIDLSTIFRKMTKNDQNEKSQEQFLNTITKNGALSFVDTRSTLPLLAVHNDHEVVLYGTALMEWKRRNVYCSNCGSADVSYQENGGTVGQCQDCHTKFWPRQDPSIIVLIVSSDHQRVLLANHVRHQHKKIYTTLAGFVEVGETMENAVVREVYEETGIRVDTTVPMQYIGTQPWPFPQSCMIGFIATADDKQQEIRIDPTEIYDAKWFTKEEIMTATSVVGSTLQTQVTENAFQQNPNLCCVIPPKGVIARKLIDTWLEEGQTTHDDGDGDDDDASTKFLHDDMSITTISAKPEAPAVHRVRII